MPLVSGISGRLSHRHQPVIFNEALKLSCQMAIQVSVHAEGSLWLRLGGLPFGLNRPCLGDAVASIDDELG